MNSKLQWLGEEVERWVGEGLIDADRASSILSRYEVEAGARIEPDQGRLITVLTLMGALLFGAGGLLFIASNWEAMDRVSKLALIFSSLIGSSLAGYRLRFGGTGFPRVGSALLFLSNILFGCGIWLVAQIFHIQSHYPNGILTWGLGVLAMAWAVDLPWVLALATALLTLWTGTEAAGGPVIHANWIFLPVLGLLVMPRVYELKSRVSLWFALISVLVWAGFAAPVWKLPYGLWLSFCSGWIAMVGVLLFTLGGHHDLDSSHGLFRGLYRRIGAFAALGSSYLLTFDDGIDRHSWLSYRAREVAGWEMPTHFAACMLCTLTLTLVLLLLMRRRSRAEIVFALATTAGTAAAILAFGASAQIRAAANVMIVIQILACIWIGYNERLRGLFNIGLLFFALELFARYYDLFWNLLPRSLFFMGGGAVLLFGGAYLEKTRRKVLASFETEDGR